MEVQYVYQKKRSEFGRQCLFSDKGPDIIDSCGPDPRQMREYILKDPVDRSTQGVPIFGAHAENTTRAEYANGFMNHIEGGWPKDVNTADEEQTKRYRRKVEKDENYHHTMMQLCKNMENSILQNNAVNIYQQYFSDVEPTPLVEKSSARTLNVYQDQCHPTRPITHISWSPDNQTKLAISHCNLTFQAKVKNESTASFIWEVENPNKPLHTLKSDHSIVCLEYNQKDAHSLVSGHLNGQVGVWDMRKGVEPVELSLMENSFRDPVHNVLWINSKSGTEFFSSSTDGQVKWWDMRKMTEPTESLIIDMVKDEDQLLSAALGVSVLEYDGSTPTRFMVGTEKGTVVSCNRKGKTALEKMMFKFNAHLGPVLALQRNPGFVKNFLTVGDWTAKIWSEDCRESAIMWTNYHKALLTDGAWSPTRLSVFFTTRTDGVLDVWDILQQQKQASLSVKVCDEPLRSMRTHDGGKLVAVGNHKGTTYLVELSDNLASSNKNDKLLLTAMFERETKREKILEARNREIRLKQKVRSGMINPEDLGMDREAIMAVNPSKEVVHSESGVFADNFVLQAEADFHNVIQRETGQISEITQVDLEGESVADTSASEEPSPPEPEPASEPEPPPPPPKKGKKAKGEGGAKKKKKK